MTFWLRSALSLDLKSNLMSKCFYLVSVAGLKYRYRTTVQYNVCKSHVCVIIILQPSTRQDLIPFDITYDTYCILLIPMLACYETICLSCSCANGGSRIHSHSVISFLSKLHERLLQILNLSRNYYN